MRTLSAVIRLPRRQAQDLFDQIDIEIQEERAVKERASRVCGVERCRRTSIGSSPRSVHPSIDTFRPKAEATACRLRSITKRFVPGDLAVGPASSIGRTTE